ncbi:U-box domain-containing protein [Striga asiatica]|uniref:U-box domain-containing protein n=1 Tax=Striga asiatica TaxID=4170 RepID=A0A5A7QTX7_STRAF|nr:U-box domain-containing protein [Striga asiatica]
MSRGKRREELYVTVPNLFRCPISMDILPSTRTTPNLTLRRLIDLWLTHDQPSPSPSLASPSPPISKQQAADLINAGGFDSDTDSLAKLIRFVAVSEENLKFVARSVDSVSRFVGAFKESDDIRIHELILEVLDLISPVDGVREMLNRLILRTGDGGDCLSAFYAVLQRGTTESKAKSARILELIAVDLESQRKIGENTEILHELFNLCTVDTDPSAVEAGFSALLAISTTRPVKKELIRLGIVRTFSGAATEHGVAVLWSVCCLARDPSAQERAASVNGLTKVLLVMQSGCSSGTRQMCVELVKVLRTKGGRSNLAPYETRTTHIAPY